MSDNNDIKIIKDFIFDDKVQDILLKINNSVMDFNILEITGMGTQEIKHSNILGWLFDDNEHNLEYQILDSFLKKVIKKNEINQLELLEEYLYLSNKKRDITIYREKDNIDLLIVDEANKIVITIENKVYASERIDGENGGQLKKYEEIINDKYPDEKDWKKYFIFLNIKLENPSDGNEKWLKANHQMITDIIENILKIKDITEKTKIVLESYVDLLKRNGIVADKELEKLCEKIWHNKEYENALEILIANKPIHTIFSKLQEIYHIDGRYGNIELDGIKKLYAKFNLDWITKKQIFEINITYLGGKNESIWLGYLYPSLLEENNIELKELCEKITNKKISSKKYKREIEILRIDKDYIKNKNSDTVVEEIKNKINQIDINIMNILNEESKLN